MRGIRLRVGIFTIVMIMTLPLISGMTLFLYRQNADLAESSANRQMDKATQDVVNGIRGIMDPIAGAVELSAHHGAALHMFQNQRVLSPVLLAGLRQQPDLYSLYIGLEDGSFLQAIRLPPGIAAFGPRQVPPPPGARFAVRTITRATGDRTVYLSEAGEEISSEQDTAIRYDPRQRPWYQDALASDQLVKTAPYIFSGTGRPGLTLSQQVLTPDRATIGVFGADLSLDSLSAVLARHKVGDRSIAFIIDGAGRLIGYPEPGANVSGGQTSLTIIPAHAAPHPVVAAAARRHAEGAKRFTMDADGTRYMASFTPLPATFHSDWTIGVIADTEDFVGPLRRASVHILLVGAVIVLLAACGTMLLSRLLTHPIARLIEETVLIRDLALHEPVTVKTHITELTQLNDALDSMKSALRSFGIYVPKELVRRLVASGSEVHLGGLRQPVTMLFSDLAGFTHTSESMAPENVLAQLSDYFDAMGQAIEENGGTIDKYVGDAIMALWNAPLADPDHAAHACRAMLACRAAEQRLNEDFVRRGLPPLHTRLGLHSGPVVVGNVGSHNRMQYTALGSAVNLASRVEGLNKKFGTQLLITGAVEEQVRGSFLLRPFGPVVASGTSVPVQLFELIDHGDAATPAVAEQLASWQVAFDAYLAGRWRTAAAGFEGFLARWPDDKAAALFLAHCRTLAEGPAGGAAVLRFDSK